MAQSVAELTKDRAVITSKIVICIFFDALLFVCWLGIAWGGEMIEQFFVARHVNELFATLFKYTSSGATFFYAVIYIIRDLYEAIADLVRTVRGRP